MELKIKNITIMGVHQFLGEGVTKNNIYWKLPKKRGLDYFQGAWQKIGRRLFLGAVDTLMHTMT